MRTQKIIHYLDMSLNMEEGKEIAENLSLLYNYINQQLFACQREKKAEPLQAAMQVVETLREA